MNNSGIQNNYNLNDIGNSNPTGTT